MDQFTQVTNQGCLGNIMASIKGVVVGTILILISLFLLFWNEGRAVHMAQSLAEGKGAVVSVEADKVDSQNEGKLVHMTALATSSETLTDPDYNMQDTAIKLRRRVEMYQWKETTTTQTHKKLGGGEEKVTTYNYSRAWENHRIESSQFREPQGHQNPSSMPSAQVFIAQKVAFGAFQLDAGLVGQMSNFQKLAVTPDRLPPQLKGKAQVIDGEYYLGTNPSAPLIGDVKVSFDEVKPAVVSIVAVQRGTTFEAYQAKAGGNTIELLTEGTHSAADMFQSAEESNATLTWILRAVGFILLLIGLCMLFGPLVAVADVVPLFGDILGAGVFVVSLGVALLLSSVTIAVAWISYRPLVGIGLLVLGVGAFFGIKQVFGKKAG